MAPSVRASRASAPPSLAVACRAVADLPALDSADVTAARRCRSAVVTDAGGSGTIMLTAGPVTEPEPHFGPGSHAGHRAAGMRTLDLSPASTLHRDVDTLAGLAVAGELGLGRDTRTALRGFEGAAGLVHLGLCRCHCRSSFQGRCGKFRAGLDVVHPQRNNNRPDPCTGDKIG
ncbi:hypothetical protein FBY31_4455 [Arthrobacter sp. SLBN-100]|nr:hypothetical protein FBY31_4455 [Arthrobacter sp. SLBN-100]